MHSSRIIIPLNSAVSAGLLWFAAVVLMVAEMYADWKSDGTLARWAILAAIAAASFTVGAVVDRARGVVLDVMSWEHKMIRQGIEEQSGNRVSPIMRKQS